MKLPTCYAPGMFRHVNRMHEYHIRLAERNLQKLREQPAPLQPEPQYNKFPWPWKQPCHRSL